MSGFITTQYFREYRKELGFTNQGDVKFFYRKRL